MNNYNYNYNDSFNNYSMYQNNNLFGPYEGYLKGNLFKDLYEQYNNYKPATLKPTSEKEQELFNLNQIHFAMHDLNLYLDVFPNDKEALSKFMEYENIYNELLENYEKKYGPINVNNTLGNTPFNWVNTSFPWEAK